MTGSDYCCLCASDEGVFLDIFTATHRQLGNRSFLKEFETCLSIKVVRDAALSSKICHKCAIELGECNRFVKKCEDVFGTTANLKKNVLTKSCCLCLTTAKNSFLFALNKDLRSTISTLQKIFECFNNQITQADVQGRLICLSCRYNLDVLYDLKRLAGEVTSKLKKIAESKAISANLPKTKTFVVSRKTTAVRQSQVEIYTPSDSDGENGTMARKGTRSKKVTNPKSTVELKLRTCGQCQNSVEGGADMYRLHTTGVTVCKMCWITMDPVKMTSGKKRKRPEEPEAKGTKLCAVFLKDVLSPTTAKDNVAYKIEKDQKGNTIYIVTDDSSESEDKSDKKLSVNKGSRHDNTNNDGDAESLGNPRSKMKRGLKAQDDNIGVSSRKRLKSFNSTETTSSVGLRSSKRNQESDSEVLSTKSKQTIPSTKKNIPPPKSTSLPKLIYPQSEDEIIVRKGKRAKNSGKNKETTSVSSKVKSEDSSSGEGEVGRKVKKVRNKVPLILKPELSDTAITTRRRAEPKTVSAISTPSIDTTEPLSISEVPPRSTKSPSSSKPKDSVKKAKALMVSFPFKLKDRYTCKVCKTKYRNKIVGMKHELTHFKQVEIKVMKLNITRHFQTVTESPTVTEIVQESVEEASHSPDAAQKTNAPSEQDVTATPGPVHSNDDKAQMSKDEMEQDNTVEQSRSADSMQRDQESDTIDCAQEADVISSLTNDPADECTTVVDKPTNETVEDVKAVLVNQTNNRTEEIETLDDEEGNTEAEEARILDDADTPEKLKEIVAESTTETSTEKLDETVDQQPAEEQVNNKSDEKDDVPEKTSDEKLKNEAIISIPSPNSPVNRTENDIEKDRDSGEEVESDTDIRIADSGSSTEETEEKLGKLPVVTDILVHDLVLDEVEVNQIITIEDNKEETHCDQLQPDTEISIISEDIIITTDKPDEECVKSEIKVDSPSEGDNTNKPQATEESDGEIVEVRPPSVVKDTLQEIFELATAEVEKRDSLEGVPETLESISDEVMKDSEETSAIIDVVESDVIEMEKLDNELLALDSNDIPLNSSSDLLEFNPTNE